MQLPVVALGAGVRARVGGREVPVAHVQRERGARLRGHVAQRARVHGHVRALVRVQQVLRGALHAAHRAGERRVWIHVL